MMKYYVLLAIEKRGHEIRHKVVVNSLDELSDDKTEKHIRKLRNMVLTKKMARH